MTPRTLITLLLGMALSAGAGAAETHAEATSASQFAEQRETIVEEMHEGGRYAEITDQQRRDVLAALDDMAALLESSPSVDAMSQADRVALFNAQEVVNTHLTLAAENSRVECKRQQTVGTHFRTSVCHTVAEWNLQREAAQSAMNQKQRGPICTGGGDCSPTRSGGVSPTLGGRSPRGGG